MYLNLGKGVPRVGVKVATGEVGVVDVPLDDFFRGKEDIRMVVKKMMKNAID
jgi:hypothetical protein